MRPAEPSRLLLFGLGCVVPDLGTHLSLDGRSAPGPPFIRGALGAHSPRTGPCPYVVSSLDAHLPSPVVSLSQCTHVAILARGRARTCRMGPALARRATWRARGERGCCPSAHPVDTRQCEHGPGRGSRRVQTKQRPRRLSCASRMPRCHVVAPPFPCDAPLPPRFQSRRFGGLLHRLESSWAETQACRQCAPPPSPWGTWPGCYPGGFAPSIGKEEPFPAGASWEERSAPRHPAWLLQAEADPETGGAIPVTSTELLGPAVLSP